MKKITIPLLIILILGLGIAGGFYIERQLGSKMLVADLDELLKTQPSIMPGMELPHLGGMPELEGLTNWINSGALDKEDLAGKVVLVDFWTYSCINCIRTLPFLNDWQRKYGDRDDFVILGVHTPEFDFESDPENVRRAVTDFGIRYPVALDNDYTTWRNFNNRFWPAKYLFDQEGNLRYSHFGEGKYDQTESAIQQLLGIDGDFTESDVPDFSQIKSPETYFGYKRGERFASEEQPLKNKENIYSFPEQLPVNTWALEGPWTISDTYSTTGEGLTKFRFKYNAGAANIVMDTPDRKQTLITVRLDGQPVPEYARSESVFERDGKTMTYIEFPQLYQLIDGSAGTHTVELEFDKPGIKVYSITFGSESQANEEPAVEVTPEPAEEAATEENP